LERLQARRPAASASAGGRSMQQASGAAQAGDAAQASEQAREAIRLLDETRQQLQQEIEQAEADLVREQMARLEQSLEGLALRQGAVVAEIRRLAESLQNSGELPPAQQATLRGIAAEQQSLAAEVEPLRLKLTADAAAFALG